MADFSFFVFSNAAEGRDEDFNRWYDEVHLGEVLSVPEFVGARRYIVAPTEEGEVPRHRYLAVYEMETHDAAATLGDLMARAGDGRLRMSDALGDMATFLYEPLGPRRAA